MQEHRSKSLEDAHVVRRKSATSNKILFKGQAKDVQLSLPAKNAATFGIMAAYFGVTLNLGMVGPSLLDLQVQTSTTTSEISTIFTCRGVLAIISSLLMGPVLDTINHLFVVAISLLALFILLAVTPWSDSLFTILLTMGPPEFFSSAIAMGVHLIGLELWQEKAGPIMQGLNLVSIVGYMVAPLLVQPFLADDELHSVTNATDSPVGLDSATIEPWMFLPDDDRGNYILSEATIASYDHQGVSGSTVPVSVARNTTNIKYVFWIAAVYCCIVGLFVFFVFARSGCKLKRKREDTDVGNNKESVTRCSKAIVAILFFFFNICLAGIEVGYAGLLLTFAVTYFGWSKESGTWLSALLQASNCLVTALCIPLSRCISPNKLLGIDVLVLTVVLLVEAIFVDDYPALLWVCTAGIGVGYAVILPSSLTWIDTFMEVSGKFSSVYWAGYFVGFMTVPALSGFLFHHVHPLCFVYVTLGCAVGMAFLFVLLSVTVCRYQLHKNPQPEVVDV